MVDIGECDAVVGRAQVVQRGVPIFPPLDSAPIGEALSWASVVSEIAGQPYSVFVSGSGSIEIWVKEVYLDTWAATIGATESGSEDDPLGVITVVETPRTDAWTVRVHAYRAMS